MGLRFRKSISLGKGVRLNISKKSIGLSAGVKGARVSVNSKGRVTKSVGIPGTGIGYVKTSQLGKSSNDSADDIPDTGYTADAAYIAPAPSGQAMPNPPAGPTPPRKAMKILAIAVIAFGLVLCAATLVGLIVTALGCWMMHRYAAQAAEYAGQEPKSPLRCRWQIIVAVFAIIFAIAGVVSPDPVNKIALAETVPATISVPDVQEVQFSYSPVDGTTDDIIVTTSDSDIASISVKSISEGKIVCLVTPKDVGKVHIMCSSKYADPVAVNFDVRDPVAEEKQRVEEEAAAKAAEQKASEEAAAKAAAEQKAAEEAAAQAAADQQAAEAAAAAATSQAAEQTVYITPSGNKYHLSASCGGKNSYSVAISDIGGRTPCKKCAGG